MSIDGEVTAQLLDFLEQCIIQKGVISVDQLFHSVTEKFPDSQSMFKNSQDLSTFMKMSPDAFHVQGNLVTLIGKPKPFEQKEKTPEEQNDKLRRPRKPREENNHVSVIRRPSTPLNNSQPDSLTSNNSSPNTQPNSLTSPIVEVASPAPPPVSLQQQSLKQRINNLLIKTLADNTERDRTLQNAVIGEALKSRVSQQAKVVVNLRECSQIMDDIMYPRKSSADGKIIVGFDCEGINVGPKGKLTLIQIATMSGQTYVFDLITCPNILQSGGLQKLLESEHVLKVNLSYIIICVLKLL